MSIEGKVALVTGAGHGIGRGIAQRLAADGASVVVSDVDRRAAETVAGEISGAGGKAIGAAGDVTDPTAVDQLVARAVGEYGSLDILVANAGIAIVRRFLDTTPEDLQALFNVNVFGVVYSIQAAARQMRDQDTGGKIILGAAAAGHEGYGLLAAYSATKFAVRGITQAAAKELARYGITVNAYCPGIVATDMWERTDAQMVELQGLDHKGAAMERALKAVPLRRPEQPEDVADFVAYLAGPGSDYMTGQSVMIDGGLVMR